MTKSEGANSENAADNDPLNSLYAKVNKPKPKGSHPDPDYTVPAPCQNVHSTGESSKEGYGTVDDTEYNALSFEAKMDVPRTEEEVAEGGRVLKGQG
nr:hypothetical protein BaRGS_001848 [Batillaria attramentaria]